MMRTAITIAVALVAFAPASAQTKKGGGSAPTPVDASVSQIHDRRTTSPFAQLSISLELAGTKASDVSAASHVSVHTKAFPARRRGSEERTRAKHLRESYHMGHHSRRFACCVAVGSALDFRSAGHSRDWTAHARRLSEYLSGFAMARNHPPGSPKDAPLRNYRQTFTIVDPEPVSHAFLKS